MNGNNKETTMNETTSETLQDMLTEEARERLASLDAKCRVSSTYENFIDNLDAGAKVKRVLRELSRKTVNIGRKVVRVGKIALDFTIEVLGEMHRRFPHVTCAILVLLILKALISSIPFFGWIFAALLEPLFMVALIGGGLGLDLLEKLFGSIAVRHFNPPSAMVH